MAKKSSSSGGSELNLDSLMDAVTNVVGVLMIVFVVMALNTARVVQKILSDLPPVTEEEFTLPTTRYEVIEIVVDQLKARANARGLGDVGRERCHRPLHPAGP